MRRSRYAPKPIEHTSVTSKRLLVLQALYRYRYLDTKHLILLADWSKHSAYPALRNMVGAGLIRVLPNNRFSRDRLKDALVYEIAQEGIDYLEAHDLQVPVVTWLRAGHYGNPDHNLKLCLSLCSMELACKAAGLGFHPWGEILAAAPESTRNSPHPFRFDVGGKRYIPDAIFTVEYPDTFACFAYELDISNHGEKDYREKFEWYHDLIFDGVYKKQLGMTQNMFVLTATITPVRAKNLLTYLPKRHKPFLIKAIPQYGLFDKAPVPDLSILDEWHTAKGELVSLKGDANGRTEDSRASRST
jgi:hypothetical protein